MKLVKFVNLIIMIFGRTQLLQISRVKHEKVYKVIYVFSFFFLFLYDYLIFYRIAHDNGVLFQNVLFASTRHQGIANLLIRLQTKLYCNLFIFFFFVLPLTRREFYFKLDFLSTMKSAIREKGYDFEFKCLCGIIKALKEF